MSDGFVDLEDGRLWYQRAGGGFPVVFVYSGLMDARIWEPQFEAFAEQHEVVRYDRRGFGRSDAPTGPFSDLRDLRALLDTLQIARCALVGCAEGAGLAFDLTLETPEAIEARRRVLAPGERLPLARSRRRRARRTGRSLGRGRRSAGRDRAAARGLGPPDLEGRSRRADGRARERGRAADRPVVARGTPAAAGRLDELRAAALLIVGEEDIAEVGEIADLVAAPVSGASKRVVAETDQLVDVGKPDRFKGLALDFLAFAG